MAHTTDRSDLLSQLQELRELIVKNTERIERLEAMMSDLVVEEEVIEEVIIMPASKKDKVGIARARMPKV